MRVKKLLLICFSLMISMAAMGQVQWASKIIEVSSEFKYDKYPGQYKAAQALGKPSVMPGVVGATGAAWVSADQDKSMQFIHVGFENPMAIRQIIINENFNAGAIARVEMFDETGADYLAYKNEDPALVAEKGRLLTIVLDKTTAFKVQSVKILLDDPAVKGFNQIDAVGISTSETPFELKINLAEGTENGKDPEKLSDNVNSDADELSPVITPDGSRLYFTRQGHPGNMGSPDKQDIWMSEIDENGNFGPSENVGEPINNASNNSLLTVSPDGQTALLLNVYLPNGSSDKGISIAKWNGESWNFPEKVEVKDYYNNHQYGEYSLGVSGKVLVMAVMRDDAISKDLYVSFWDDEANGWSVPKHMGPTVNTAESEVSPFLAADERTLYFATKGLPGYGGSDMFMTRRLDDSWTNWTEPVNLGPMLNTPEFDAYYTIPADGKYAYFVSYKDGGENSDIYRAELPKSLRPDPVVMVRGKVRNKKTGDPIGTGIVIENFQTGESVGIANSDPQTGDYKIVLPAGYTYGFRADAKGFVSINENLDLKELESYETIEKNLDLVPFEVGETILLNNIFFDYDKATLKKESLLELNRLARMMKDFPAMEIEVMGHTDDKGSETYNMDLSRKRAESVKEYLLTQGIAAAKMDAKGYGEDMPIVPNDTPENRARNRRVEFKILKK